MQEAINHISHIPYDTPSAYAVNIFSAYHNYGKQEADINLNHRRDVGGLNSGYGTQPVCCKRDGISQLSVFLATTQGGLPRYCADFGWGGRIFTPLNIFSTRGWGGRIRTFEWRLQRALPYRLATPQSGEEKILYY